MHFDFVKHLRERFLQKKNNGIQQKASSKMFDWVLNTPL